MKQKFRYINYGDVNFAEPSLIEPNTIYVEKDPEDPNVCAMYTANSAGTSVIPGVSRSMTLPKNKLDELVYDVGHVTQVNHLKDAGSFSHTAYVENNLRNPDGTWKGAMLTSNRFNITGYNTHDRVDSYENNSSTYGGTEAPIGPIVTGFMDALEIPDTPEARRYGRAYAILEITHDPAHTNTNWTNMRGIDVSWGAYCPALMATEMSFGYWVYGVSGDVMPSYSNNIIDGVLVSTYAPRITNGSWHYISNIYRRTTSGIGVYPMPIYMSRDTICRIALPHCCPGLSYPRITKDEHKWLRT